MKKYAQNCMTDDLSLQCNVEFQDNIGRTKAAVICLLWVKLAMSKWPEGSAPVDTLFMWGDNWSWDFSTCSNTNIWDHHLIRTSNYSPLGVALLHPLVIIMWSHLLLNPLLSSKPNLFTPPIKMLLNIDGPGPPEISLDTAFFCAAVFQHGCISFAHTFSLSVVHLQLYSTSYSITVCMLLPINVFVYLMLALCSTSCNWHCSATVIICKWEPHAVQHCQWQFWMS